MAVACAQLGRIDEAFALIDELLSERNYFTIQVPADPLLDPLRSDPRWEKVLERLGLR
jgi:pentatricopeptide repeat protein